MPAAEGESLPGDLVLDYAALLIFMLVFIISIRRLDKTLG